jgi:hypothetical protein
MLFVSNYLPSSLGILFGGYVAIWSATQLKKLTEIDSGSERRPCIPQSMFHHEPYDHFYTTTTTRPT